MKKAFYLFALIPSLAFANTPSGATKVQGNSIGIGLPVQVVITDENGTVVSGGGTPTGTAGTPSASVVTVQGIAGMTALKVDGSAVTQPVSGTVTANAGTGTFASSVADGANVALGAIADAAWTSGSGSSIALLKAIDRDTLLPLAAGTNLIGKVGIDQTTPGTTNAVSSTGSVASGTTDSGNPVKVGAKYNATLPTFTDGQRADLQANSRGELLSSISQNGTVAQVSGSFADARSNSTANLTTASYLMGFNGTTWDRLRGDVTGGLWSQGAVASGGTDSGNPVKVGGLYTTSVPTFTTGQRGDFQITSRGELKVAVYSGNTTAAMPSWGSDGATTAQNGLGVSSVGLLYNGSTLDRMQGSKNGLVVQSALPGNIISYAAASGGISNTTTAVTVASAAGASTRNYISSIQLSTDGTLGAATEFAIRDGAAGTVLWRFKLTTAGLANGLQVRFDPPLKGTANTLTEVVTLTASVTGAVFFNMQGFTGI